MDSISLLISVCACVCMYMFLALDRVLFQLKSTDIFLIYPRNICYGYTSDAPRRGASNEYPQHMFSWRNKETLCGYPSCLKLCYC